jgi:hypothetical protein
VMCESSAIEGLRLPASLIFIFFKDKTYIQLYVIYNTMRCFIMCNEYLIRCITSLIQLHILNTEYQVNFLFQNDNDNDEGNNNDNGIIMKYYKL